MFLSPFVLSKACKHPSTGHNGHLQKAVWKARSKRVCSGFNVMAVNSDFASNDSSSEGTSDEENIDTRANVLKGQLVLTQD